MPDNEFSVTFQKETKSFIVYERKEGETVVAIVYLPRAMYAGTNPTSLKVRVSS
jgi:hypothetical protein